MHIAEHAVTVDEDTCRNAVAGIKVRIKFGRTGPAERCVRKTVFFQIGFDGCVGIVGVHGNG